MKNKDERINDLSQNGIKCEPIDLAIMEHLSKIDYPESKESLMYTRIVEVFYLFFLL